MTFLALSLSYYKVLAFYNIINLDIDVYIGDNIICTLNVIDSTVKNII